MSAPALYRKRLTTPEKLRWGDFFEASGTQHSEQDLDYAMLAGTTLDSAETEVSMLQKWQIPWLYKKALLAGLLSSGIIVLCISVMIIIYGCCEQPALNLLLIVIPPCVMPVTLNLFFWEMNVPRNISLLNVLGYFFLGGVVSIMFTMVFESISPTTEVYLAPLTEEPAKLLLSLVFLRRLYQKKGKIYGLNGLVIGASVGAGFAAFESAQYAYNAFPILDPMLPIPILHLEFGHLRYVFLSSILLRAICSFCGHILFCAPYSCIAAINIQRKGNGPSFIDIRFLIVFAISFFSHMLWNTDFLSDSFYSIVLRTGIFSCVLWGSCLYCVRQSFLEIKSAVTITPSNLISNFKIIGTKGQHTGICFSLTQNETLIGSDAVCKLNYPISTPSISKKHGKFIIQNGALYIGDFGGVDGIWVNGKRLQPLTGQLLNSGDVIWIGSSEQEFVIQ